MKKIINNNPKGYNELRNIISKEPEIFINKEDIFNFGLKVTHKLTGKSYHPFWKGFYFNFQDQTTPCHFFNTINLGRNSWKVHFETKLPRLGKAPKFFYDLGIKKLASENCKEIIAISECAYDLQLQYLENNYPDYVNSIKGKMKIELPPQEPYITSYFEKALPHDKIIFTIVGGDFFRKGGREVLSVFDELIPKNDQLQLNIVSSLNYGDYATRTTLDDFLKAKKILEKYPENIRQFQSLPNSQVMELFKNSHIGLLPTWADSFGYSVLEAQAAGCPVITTDIRALPEINNDKIGWIINVPKFPNGNGDIDSIEKREIFKKQLKINLEHKVREIMQNPKIIEVKGKAALESIKKEFRSDSIP